MVGAVIPDADLLDADGRPVRLDASREPVLVLNLFAFWCDTWKAQLRQLRELADEQTRLGFRLVSVSIDGTWREQLKVVCGKGLPFPVLLDPGGVLSRRLGVRRVPTLIVARRGQVTYVHEGYPGNGAVLRAIRKAAGPGPRPDTEKAPASPATLSGGYP
jgi:peroxiredoxin